MGTVKIGNKKVFLLEPDKFQPVIYSTEEREIGVWTDGKPLYQKTFPINSDSISTNLLSDLNIHYIVDLYVIEYSASVLKQVFLQYNTNTKLLVNLPTGQHWYYQLVVKYTKTTDTAGSGTWTPQGVPSHHYSTNEHVIGTWIDGSTIYEKTWDYSSSPITLNTGSQWTDMQVASSYNIGHIINAIVDEETTIMQSAEIAVGASNFVVAIRNYTGNARNISYLTLQYTKSS